MRFSPWQSLTIGGVAVMAGGVSQSWPLLWFGIGVMGSTTIASAVMEDRHPNRKA